MPDDACGEWQVEAACEASAAHLTCKANSASPLMRAPMEIALQSPASNANRPQACEHEDAKQAKSSDSERDLIAWRAIDRSLVDRVRREFFARASVPAERYGVTPDDVLTHLDQAHLGDAAGAARVLAHLEDVAIAVACVRGHPRAWADLWERHESPLIRACHTRLDDADAIIFTRRFWVSLFTTTVTNREPMNRTTAISERTGGGAQEIVPLTAYVGVRPLRVWLTDRLLGVLEAAVQRAREASAANRTRVEPASATAARPSELRWKYEGIVFRAIRRRGSGSRSDIRLRLVD
jgi:hypothetical protein